MITDPRNDLLSNKGQSLRMPILGNLRSGIKRLVRPKKEATQKEIETYNSDMKIYESMVAKGASWDDIEKAIGTNKDGRSKLTPENQDYFTVRAIDCKTNPENAEILHRLYADSDGKIRTIPIVFMFSDWFENIPHGLQCWSVKELRYWSEYMPATDPETGEKGFERICMRPIPHQKGKRPFGGRDSEMRGLCRPAECNEYQKGECKFKGYVQGIIPGTRGAGLWQIHSTSYYSFQQMRSKLALVEATTGRLQGLYDPETRKPILSVNKVGDEEIKRFDVKEGVTKNAEQDLIYIEADIDMFNLMLAYQPQAVLERGQRATAALTGQVAPPQPEQPEQPKKTYVVDGHGQATPAPDQPTPQGSNIEDDFLPELEGFDSPEEPGEEEEDLPMETKSAVLRDHFRSELTKCHTAARYRELQAEFRKSTEKITLAPSDKEELRQLWAETAGRLRGDKAA